MERENNPTTCTVRVVIKGGNEWKPLRLAKEPLTWEMKKAKRLTSSNCRGRNEEEELRFGDTQTNIKEDTVTDKFTFLTDFFSVLPLAASLACLSDPITWIYATQRLYRDMFAPSKTSVSFVGGGWVAVGGCLRREKKKRKNRGAGL